MKARTELSSVRAAPKPTPQLKSSIVIKGVQLSAQQRACRAGIAAVLAGATAVNSLLWPLQCDALTPYEESKRMVYGPTADGSIRGCPSNVSEAIENGTPTLDAITAVSGPYCSVSWTSWDVVAFKHNAH